MIVLLRILIVLAAMALVSPASWHVRAAELNPRLVGTYVGASPNWNPVAIATSATQAYVTYSDYNPASGSWDNGLLILDLTNPSNPTRLGSLKARWIGDLAVGGDFAFACASSDGLLVIDVSNPAAPRRIRSVPIGQAAAVFLQGNLAFVADAMSALVVVDVSTPANARRVGRIRTTFEASGVFVAGNYAYVSERYWDDAAGQELGNLEIVDIQNPASPEVVGSVPIDFGAYSVLVSGTVAYLGGGKGEPQQLLDVSDPAAPRHLGSFESLARGILREGRVYMYGGTPGMEVLDVSDPASPRRMGGFKPNGSAWGIGISGIHAVLGILGQGVAVIELEPPPTAAPALAITRAGTAVRLSWPLSATGYALEIADAVPAFTTWSSATNAPEAAGDQNNVTLKIGASPRFFRLRMP